MFNTHVTLWTDTDSGVQSSVDSWAGWSACNSTHRCFFADPPSSSASTTGSSRWPPLTLLASAPYELVRADPRAPALLALAPVSAGLDSSVSSNKVSAVHFYSLNLVNSILLWVYITICAVQEIKGHIFSNFFDFENLDEIRTGLSLSRNFDALIYFKSHIWVQETWIRV